MARPANIVCEPNGYLSFYSGTVIPSNLMVRGNSIQCHALAGNILKNAEGVEVAESNGNKILTIKGQRWA